MRPMRVIARRSATRCFVAAAALSMATVCAAAVATGTARARVGARPATFTLPAVPGGPTQGRFSLAEHLGRRPVVILFWATWCAPCRQELPLYQRLYERLRGRGLVVVAISMDDASSIGGAGPMARRMGLTFPVLSDLDTSVTTRLNPRRAAPFSIWIDRNGLVVREREGFSMAEREQITRGVERLVAMQRTAP
ncbi:MAG: TlpA family protein disulfide reductase [Myxococcota bacterium]|nr:TlpA family protein disulfide reductase [Myxococcota bacterium]MDW8361109.1 TlpA disulfide reductase family protein [Myxococcales bacterium]